MIKKVIKGTILSGFISLLLFSISFAADAFERELVVKDQTRVMKVEAVFKQLLQAYEDESANDFLALVSDERFRQDYITFTDALYSDFRKYEIKDVTYWIDRVTSDHIKQFLYVKWEKRYVDLNDGSSGMTSGFSRFLFDEVNGKYLLVELAGNSLFGASLQEWVDETPRISGEVRVAASTPVTGDCGPGALGGCDNQLSCERNGGHWYNSQCNSQPQNLDKADLKFDLDNSGEDGSAFKYTILNTGSAASTPCKMEIICFFTITVDIPAIPAGGSYGPRAEDVEGRPRSATIDSDDSVDEGTDGGEDNNQWTSPI